MSATPRLRRSLLYMPGSNPRALQKARALPADGLIFDLEDAVAPEEKEHARAIVGAALAEGGYGHRELVLRVNAIDTPWGHADLAAAAAMPIDAVLLPKVENPDRVALTLSLLDAFGASDRLAVWCMLETPRGILFAREIAGAERLAALVVGTSDLSKDLRALPSGDRLPLLTSLGLAILAARANGLAILDGVHLDLSDDEGFAAACRQGRELGFDGKTLIHPKQIAAANAAFAPTKEEIERSRRIIAAHAKAIAAGKGVVVVDGRLVEELHVKDATRLLALDDEIRRLSSLT
ncbi:MAG: CoA ester lyase [Alphaproteobacteria bacterium]|nr:CoA ester lyase [Alphaproteobacteria bacterium]